MMNYEIFKEVVKEKFLDYMPEKYKGMEVVTAPVEKVNMTLDGLSLREEGKHISPTIYINDMVLEALSPRNLVVMDMKSGSLTIALGATEYKRYPKDEKPTKDNTTIGVSWEHGIYLGSTLSTTNFKAYKREYGTPEKIEDIYDYRAKLKQKFYFYQDMSKDDDVPKKLQNDFLHQMYEDFGTIEEDCFYDRLEDGKYDEGFKERQVKEEKSR